MGGKQRENDSTWHIGPVGSGYCRRMYAIKGLTLKEARDFLHASIEQALTFDHADIYGGENARNFRKRFRNDAGGAGEAIDSKQVRHPQGNVRFPKNISFPLWREA